MNDVQSCANTLIRDTVEMNLSYRQALSYLSIIDKQTFDFKKQSASFVALLDDIPVSLEYGEMKQEISRLLNVLSIDQSVEMHKHVFVNSLSGNSLEAYKTCVTGMTQAQRELDLSVESVSKSLLRIKGRWNPSGANAKAFDKLEVEVVGAKLLGRVPTPTPRTDFNLRLERSDPDSEVSCVVRALSTNGDTLAEDEVGAEPYVLIERVPEEKGKSTDDAEFSQGGRGAFVYHAPSGAKAGALPISIGASPGGWRIDPKTVSVSAKWQQGGIGIEWSPNPLRCDGRTISGVFNFTHNPKQDGAHNAEACEMKISWIERRVRTKKNGQFVDGYASAVLPFQYKAVNPVVWKSEEERQLLESQLAYGLAYRGDGITDDFRSLKP